MRTMKDIRELDLDSLKSLYTEMNANMYNLNVKQDDDGFKPHLFKAYRRTIARILTHLKEKGGK